MKPRLRFGLGLAGGVVGVAGLAAARAAAWRRTTDAAVAALDDAAPSGDPCDAQAVFDPVCLVGLPAPVQRYLTFALRPGQPLVRRAHLTQAGDFRSGGVDSAWANFTARHEAALDPPAFVWDAAIRMAPFVVVRVRDGYHGGAGRMQAAVGGVVPVVDAAATPELASGALHRFLAESPWYPTALLPSERLRWEAMDDRHARALLRDGDVEVAVECTIDERGRITRVFAPARFRDVDGVPVPTPWEGRFSDYERVHGMMIPTCGEVAWLLADGRLPYWRGRLLDVRYEVAAPGSDLLPDAAAARAPVSASRPVG